ncbi:MAG: class I SAM-dependent methyltransferase [Terriglobia bacterium]
MAKRRLELRGVPPYCPRHRILDVGCGSGNFVREMEQLGWEAYGLELNHGAARYARDQMNLKVSQGSLPNSKMEGGFFDVVTMFDTFEHMPNPIEVLEDAQRILTPGGLLILNTPNFNSLYRKVFKDRWFNVAAPLHYYLYAKEPLKAMLQRSGFLVEKFLYPLGEAGLEQTILALLTGKLARDHSLLHRLLHLAITIPHRLSPGGHLLLYAVRLPELRQ